MKFPLYYANRLNAVFVGVLFAAGFLAVTWMGYHLGKADADKWYAKHYSAWCLTEEKSIIIPSTTPGNTLIIGNSFSSTAQDDIVWMADRDGTTKCWQGKVSWPVHFDKRGYQTCRLEDKP